MKKLFKYGIIIICSIFIITFLSKIIINKIFNKDDIELNSEYKLENDLYFSNNDIELTLYKDGTYFMHQPGNNNAGKYEFINNYIKFTINKKFNYTCYDSVNSSLVANANFEDSNLIDITIDNNILHSVDDVNVKKDNLSNIDIDCSNDVETNNKKYKHDIIINNGNINYTDEIGSDKEEINAFLKEFFDRYYDIISTLEYKDISDMFENDENMYIYKTALDLLLENRKNNPNDLTLSNVKYELNVQNFSKTNNEVAFKVLENCSYNFEFIKRYTTSVYNIENEFKLVKINGKYKVRSYKKVQDFYVMITDLYNHTADYKAALDKIKSDYLKKFETENNKLNTMKENYLNNNYTLLTCDHEFNRSNAYDYATKWVGRRNTDSWYTYGSNCVNFVSQVMYAGGIPMDYYGNAQWKWYSATRNTANTPSGFVYEWTYVPSISNYFKTNTGFGLCGKYDENIYLGDIGDVVAVGTIGPTRHVVSVIGQIKDENGKVIDLLVSSNTVDLIYFPLSAYAYPYRTLMKVYGYND